MQPGGPPRCTGLPPHQRLTEDEIVHVCWPDLAAAVWNAFVARVRTGRWTRRGRDAEGGFTRDEIVEVEREERPDWHARTDIVVAARPDD